uniref:hypothetical protein n=1 Tax=uncultured Polaribacter sp. TaxID=174711 RepID=UPI002626AE5E|nr:hypothetical protein [uncultured Polaribacter sp.]
MKKIIRKPHLFFFGLIPIFLIIGFINRNIPIDINISFIYYLINVDFWCYVSAVYFGLIGINYLSLNIIKKEPKKGLTITHLVLQVLCLLPYLYAVLNLDENGNLPNSSFFNSVEFNYIFIGGFLLFITSIFVHLINFFSSLLLKRD